MSSSQSTNINWPESPGRGRPPQSYYDDLEQLAKDLKRVQERLDFKMSARGWAYFLENEGFINKSQIDYAENRINKLRKNDFSAGWDHAPLPSDFTAQDESRSFDCVERSNFKEPEEYVKKHFEYLLDPYINTSFWESQDYFIQVLVEKIDLKELFKPICEQYNIPIATAKGWSSINQRAKMLSRYIKWVQEDKKPVLLYCGDFDPAGLQISDKLMKNFDDLKDAQIPYDGDYLSGFGGTDIGLEIDRIGLDEKQVKEWNLPWIENLETSGDYALDDPRHDEHDQPYVQQWIDEIGVRKVEANALVTQPKKGKKLFKNSVEEYLGDNPTAEYEKTREEKRKKVQDTLCELGIQNDIERALSKIE